MTMQAELIVAKKLVERAVMDMTYAAAFSSGGWNSPHVTEAIDVAIAALKNLRAMQSQHESPK